MPWVFKAITAILVTALPCLVAAGPRDLTFEERVRAQEAIERVYYAHQIGATRPFEEAVPRATLERKVRTYLKESLALERLWGAPMTAAALREEWERIARSTRMPERLEELHAALGHDAMLIQECLVRPVLVHRLVRQASASGGTNRPAGESEASVRGTPSGVGGTEVAAWDAPRAGLLLVRADRLRSGRHLDLLVASDSVGLPAWDAFGGRVEVDLNERDVEAIASADEAVSVTTPTCTASDTWAPIVVASNSPSPRRSHTAIWTGSLMIIWGGAEVTGHIVYLTNTGGRYDPVLDAWTTVSTVNAPTARWLHTAVWTGERMVVWGGDGVEGDTNTGGRYDPATDSWLPTATTDAPSPRSAHTAIWSGSSMVVWGGGPLPEGRTGGRYDPESDAWAPTSLLNAPTRRALHSAVWTGASMIVWGGEGSSSLNTGGRYDPSVDTWLTTSLVNAPTPRNRHTAVWTGDRMLVWGASGNLDFDTGASYDPVTDTWTQMSTVNAPSGRISHTAVWTGEAMIVWGGSYGVVIFDTGGQYHPTSDTWAATETAGAPAARSGHTAVQAGDLMLVWGGQISGYSTDDGGEYCVCAAGSFYQDADGDGRGDAAISAQACSPPAGFVADGSDCDDTDPAVWGTPSEVQDLVWLDGDNVAWTPPVDPGGAVVVYDLLRSNAAADFVAGAACVESDLSSTSAVDLTNPGSGVAFFYLVRAESRCLVGGQGPLGWASDGTPRTGRSCP